ncbi:MAG: hypothetical protein ACRD1C_02545 [Terriglobales bacterium]
MSAGAEPVTVRQLCHDLSQPLMAAHGSLEVALQLAPQDPARTEFLRDALAALERMTAEIERARNAVLPAAGAP